IDRYQQAEALAELARAQQAGQPVPAGYEGITVTAEQAADAIRLGEELRQAVQHLVWQRYFHADPETHAAGELRLAPAVGWIKDIFDQAHRSLRPEDGDALAQEFFLGKILERNILRQFQPKLRSSFNQWIKISLQNY